MGIWSALATSWQPLRQNYLEGFSAKGSVRLKRHEHVHSVENYHFRRHCPQGYFRSFIEDGGARPRNFLSVKCPLLPLSRTFRDGGESSVFDPKWTFSLSGISGLFLRCWLL